MATSTESFAIAVMGAKEQAERQWEAAGGYGAAADAVAAT